VLIAFADSNRMTDATRGGYFAAVRDMSSDYERRRVLIAIVDDELTPAMIGDVIDATAPMSSDYEKATVLVALLRRHPVTGALRDRLMRVAQDMSSQYESNRVLAALARRTE
jgi:hypothetical protein